LTLDSDALELLMTMAQSRNRYGAFVSELLRSEWQRREVRRELVDELASAGCTHITADGA